MNPGELLAARDATATDDEDSSTGLADLDALTDGGLRSGQVWVVTGEVGEGKTTLAVQWALALARDGHTVRLVAPREPASYLTARMLANLSHVPLSHLAAGRADPSDEPRLGRAREALRDLGLEVWPEGSRFVPETDLAERRSLRSAVVVDDADLVAGLTPELVAACAREGSFVLLTLPRTTMLAGADETAPLDPRWGRIADVVLEVCHRRVEAISDPSEPTGVRAPEHRPGEADLLVHRHRWGPALTLHVAFQGHYARFVDLARLG